jgi:hypothetical protein
MPRPRSRIQFQLALVEPSPTRLPQRVVPSVDPWVAGEMFFSPHVEERRRGLALLMGSEATRRSPLVPQLLAMRLDESDLRLRAQIVQALGDYFEERERKYRYPPDIRAVVVGCLRKFDDPHLVALLELLRGREQAALHFEALQVLVERIPDAAARFARLATDRTVALDLRRSAIELVGRAGLLDALPVMAGLETRLEGHTAGQLTLGFAPTDSPEDQALLPTLKETLRRLREAAA